VGRRCDGVEGVWPQCFGLGARGGCARRDGGMDGGEPQHHESFRDSTAGRVTTGFIVSCCKIGLFIYLNVLWEGVWMKGKSYD
jgi:hypothetical protein